MFRLNIAFSKRRIAYITALYPKISRRQVANNARMDLILLHKSFKNYKATNRYTCRVLDLKAYS